MKKLLSLFVVLCMMIPTAAWASDERETEFPSESASQALFDLGLLKGDGNGDLMEEDSVTRAEFLTMLSRIVKDYSPIPAYKFADVSDSYWASGVIGYFSSKGLIDGYDEVFAPEDPVTLAHAAKMIISVLGFDESGLKYPDDYMILGARKQILSGVDIYLETNLNREQSARLILNALYVKNSDGKLLIEDINKKTYYVSAAGSDTGNGAYDTPWNTIDAALSNVTGAGIIYILEGTYTVNEPVTLSKGGDDAKNPLIIKGAFDADVKIIYSGEESSIKVESGADFITVSNISFETNADSKTAAVDCKGDNFTFSRNYVTNADYAVFAQDVDGITVSDTVIDNCNYGIKLSNCDHGIVKGNTIYADNDYAVSIDGNSKNALVYNNNIYIENPEMETAVLLGNADDNDTSLSHSAVWQNVIYADVDDIKAKGITFANTDNCIFFNNVVSGTDGSVEFKGDNINTVFRNNIFSECGEYAYVFSGKDKSINSDYNCFYESYPIMNEPNSKYSNPFFITTGENWNLISFSPCRDSGAAIEPYFTGYNGEVLKLDLKDVDGVERTGLWSMGIYSTVDSNISVGENEFDDIANEPKPFFSYEFENGVGRFSNNGGEWSVKDGVYHQTSTNAASYRSVYTEGFSWEDYELSVDVKSTSSVLENATGVLFRCDEEMQNMYAFRFLAENKVQFVKWKDNKYSLIQQWDYEYTPETFYNFNIKAKGNVFTFHINGEYIGEVKDNNFSKGSIGCYSYREPNEYDNIKVYALQ